MEDRFRKTGSSQLGLVFVYINLAEICRKILFNVFFEISKAFGLILIRISNKAQKFYNSTTAQGSTLRRSSKRKDFSLKSSFMKFY
jgi:hypothetical protein